MKRINIHFDGKNLEALDEILQKVKRKSEGSGWLWSLTRADLIRFAVAKVYGLEFNSSHTWGSRLLDVLKKAKAIKIK